MRKGISLCMIVKDEESNVSRAIKSVQGLVDEIIVVDTGSRDNTVELALGLGAKVYSFEWCSNFSLARNYSIQQASCEWIMILDADDVLNEKHREKFSLFKVQLDYNPFEAYYFKTLSFMGSPQGHDLTASNMVRIFKNRPHYRYEGAIHEQIIPSILRHHPISKIAFYDIVIYHYGYTDTEVDSKKKHLRNLLILKDELKKNKNSIFYTFCLGNEHFALGNYKKAMSCYKRCHENFSMDMPYGSSLLARMTMSYLLLGDCYQCLNLISQAQAFYPGFTDLQYLKAAAYYKQNNMLDALKSYIACIKMGESPPEISFIEGTGTYRPHYGIASLYLNKGQYLNAAIHLACSLLHKRDYGPSRDMLMHIQSSHGFSFNAIAKHIGCCAKNISDDDVHYLQSLFSAGNTCRE